MDIDDKTMDKAKKSLDTIPVQKHLVVCNKCGSTNVSLRGADPPDELVCESCDNTMSWNGRNFLLIQYEESNPDLDTLVGVKRAVEHGTEKAEKRSAEQGDS